MKSLLDRRKIYKLFKGIFLLVFLLLFFPLATPHSLQDLSSHQGLNLGHSSESPESYPLDHWGTPRFSLYSLNITSYL